MGYYDPERRQFSETVAPYSFIALVIFLLLLFFLSGCEVVNSLDERGKVIVQVNNQRNCTPALIMDIDGTVYKKISAHSGGEFTVSRNIFEPRDETQLLMQTPPKMIDLILAGERGVIPKGCDNWGYDSERIRLPDGYETEPVKVRLRPPNYWDERDNWK